MGYFNYHAKIKNLIKQNHLVDFVFYDDYNGIKNCMVLFFDNHKPMPVRDYRIGEYFKFFEENNINIPKKIDK